ncbi:hypothetical protein VUR80DRAFT_6587 [Thermomyces stellatus]
MPPPPRAAVVTPWPAADLGAFGGPFCKPSRHGLSEPEMLLNGQVEQNHVSNVGPS